MKILCKNCVNDDEINVFLYGNSLRRNDPTRLSAPIETAQTF